MRLGEDACTSPSRVLKRLESLIFPSYKPTFSDSSDSVKETNHYRQSPSQRMSKSFVSLRVLLWSMRRNWYIIQRAHHRGIQTEHCRKLHLHHFHFLPPLGIGAMKFSFPHPSLYIESIEGRLFVAGNAPDSCFFDLTPYIAQADIHQIRTLHVDRTPQLGKSYKKGSVQRLKSQLGIVS